MPLRGKRAKPDSVSPQADIDVGAGRPSEADRMVHFAADVFSIQTDGGVPLPEKPRLAEPRSRRKVI